MWSEFGMEFLQSCCKVNIPAAKNPLWCLPAKMRRRSLTCSMIARSSRSMAWMRAQLCWRAPSRSEEVRGGCLRCKCCSLLIWLHTCHLSQLVLLWQVALQTHQRCSLKEKFRPFQTSAAIAAYPRQQVTRIGSLVTSATKSKTAHLGHRIAKQFAWRMKGNSW